MGETKIWKVGFLFAFPYVLTKATYFRILKIYGTWKCEKFSYSSGVTAEGEGTGQFSCRVLYGKVKILSEIFPGVLEVPAYLLFPYKISPGRKINNPFFFFARLRLRVYFGQTVAMWWYSTKVPAHHGFPLLQLRTKKKEEKKLGWEGKEGSPKTGSPLYYSFLVGRCAICRQFPISRQSNAHIFMVYFFVQVFRCMY